jgi:hypothetical protein
MSRKSGETWGTLFLRQKNGPIAGAKFQEATDLVGNVRKGDESRSGGQNGSGSDARNRKERRSCC